ncbi:hypothetical protein SporoP37_00230 [Sporosarcina sp. P37]|uniref:hypothetical protein n=1 Tax=Sporosarcina sp. P37 TaxID=1930546 RepID=UPI000A17B631|nr:hypothetical protein [Sporosarcina sp. P37]ARK23268.1 hypothetical protein SporoP37_00230 [Sporosarcina sp. P37]PID19518.1 hypothetical protein CSV62_03180 [Sporosarcina sp. P35]
MATNVYACLCGDWVNLNDDPDCKMGGNLSSPSTWWEEGAEIWSPINREKKDTLYELDYIWIHYKGKDYRINPMYLQIVES